MNKREQTSELALRVFKRSSKHLVLLWKKFDEADPLQTAISFKSLKSDGRVIRLDSRQYELGLPSSGSKTGKQDGLEDVSVSDDTVICVIQERNVGLDPDTPYYTKVFYGGKEEGIRLTPAGVFPSHEREAREKNTHLYLWDEPKQVWRKASGIQGPDGSFCLPVVIVERQDNDLGS